MIPQLSERGLILAPMGRDARVAASMLAEAKIDSAACASLMELVGGLNRGAGFAVVTEEALRTVDLHPLAEWIGAQPEWSDFPFILLTLRGGIERRGKNSSNNDYYETAKRVERAAIKVLHGIQLIVTHATVL